MKINFNFTAVPYVEAKFIPQVNEYRCGINDCNKLLFKGEIITGRVEKKCVCGVINIVEQPPRFLGSISFQDRLKLNKK